MKVCEYEIKCCPYCGAKEESLREADYTHVPNCHTICCESCHEIFYTPCED